MELLSGNEAIAQGAWQAGASIGVAYPGTPSTETLECFAKKENVYAEWCTNEKVAVEVAIGASAAGARVLATMKHVGVNVAADPLFTAAYTGVGGGLVVLAADDPGMYSSQNEQDSHYYAQAAHIPMLDPADSSEALRFTQEAFDISEKFDVPVIIRSSVRVSHTKTLVETGAQKDYEQKPYEKMPSKWVMMPAYAKPRRKVQLERINNLCEWVENCSYNVETPVNTDIGIICSGAVYQHVKEALPDASILKLGVTWPLPINKIREFANRVERLYVIEEASDYLTLSVRSCGVEVQDTPCDIPHDGELSPGLIRSAFGIETPEHIDVRKDLPNRPPALCAGCPHRLVFRELSRLHAIVTGDIGCYTLGALPPLEAMDTCVCMGASVSMAHGFELALSGKEHKPIVAVIGDSTFAHSGLSGLISTAYNVGCGTICILDNRTTAMTGRQGNPFNGVTLQDRPSREIDPEKIVRACGIDDVHVVNPHVADVVKSTLEETTQASDKLSVIIFRSPCALLERKRDTPFVVNESCSACGVCSTLGCPAISFESGSDKAFIDSLQCIGCGQCAQYCKFGAIVQA